MTPPQPIQYFPALDALGVCRAAFITRIPGIDVRAQKAEVLQRLETTHAAMRDTVGMGDWPLIAGEQVHGNRIKLIHSPVRQDETFAGFDGFITKQRHVALGIYVADCCAVYIV
ncbi:MAG TPA: laccase domain-containing protein, partial [Chthoniobacterales bacterium]|nr:laccase domain-containing protein [Chthoniobacterales bacterium]